MVNLRNRISSPKPSATAVSSRVRFLSPWLFALTLVWLAVYWQAFPDPVGLAAGHWPLILIGVLGAVIGNVTAIGGGIVFIPVMMFVYKTDPISALKLAFVTQAVGMTSGASGWLQRGEVPLNMLKYTVPALVAGALVSTFLIHPHAMMIKALFGPVALTTGLLTLITLDNEGITNELPVKARLPVMSIALVGGLITGWVAIGEGEIVAAFCMLVYGLNANRAIGLGVVLLAINSVLLALIHALYFGGVPWELAAFTMLGVLWGGRLGPFLAQWLSLRAGKKLFAYIAVLDGLLVSLQAAYVLFIK